MIILEVKAGCYKVISTDGDDHLGGQDIYIAIYKYLIECFKNQENGEDLTENENNDP